MPLSDLGDAEVGQVSTCLVPGFGGEKGLRAEKCEFFGGPWPDRSRKGRPFSKVQGSLEGLALAPRDVGRSPGASCPN